MVKLKHKQGKVFCISVNIYIENEETNMQIHVKAKNTHTHI